MSTIYNREDGISGYTGYSGGAIAGFASKPDTTYRVISELPFIVEYVHCHFYNLKKRIKYDAFMLRSEIEAELLNIAFNTNSFRLDQEPFVVDTKGNVVKTTKI